MKVTIDFEDLFAEYENNETAIQQVKDAVERRAVEYLAMRIGFALESDIDKSFPMTLHEEGKVDLSHDDIHKLSDIVVKKYKKKIQEDLTNFFKGVI